MRLFFFLSAALIAQDSSQFERRVRPVLAARCVGCHGAAAQMSGLRLDSREGVRKGGARGALAETLLKAVRHEGLKMPPDGKLPAAEVGALEEWVRAGLPYPASASPMGGGAHWAYVAPKASSKPLAELLRGASARAPLAVAMRRASFVLTGLPPSREDLRSTTSLDVYVDKLLASPHFGERWARHWMDVVRYAETYGYEWNFEIHGAWRYRDYLIRAFNEDVPFDVLTREHIAGDLLPNARPDAAIGTAFFRLGEMGHDNCNQFREIRTDVVDNQIDTLSKAFQGVTVSCARCHDHKIDPIPTEDYYALYGILNGSRPIVRTIGARPVNSLATYKEKARGELTRLWLAQASTLALDINAALNDSRPHDAARTQTIVKLLDGNEFESLLSALRSRSAADYKKEQAAREKFNREKFVEIANFTEGIPAGWTLSGHGASHSKAGDFALAASGPSALHSIFEGGVYTHALTDRFNGTLRSPYLPREKKFLTIEGFAGNLGAVRAVMDHCVIGEDHRLIENRESGFIRISNKNEQPLPVYIEFNTKDDNPRIPERDGNLKITESQLANPRSHFGVTRIWAHDEAVAPKASLAFIEPLLSHAEPDPAKRFQLVTIAAIERFRDGRATALDAKWLNWMLANGLLLNSRHSVTAVAEYRAEESRISSPAVFAGMGDFDAGADHPIFVGGQATNPGRLAPRHFLSLLPEELRAAKGRLELAASIASPRNPLTARVYVNRLWHHVFGEGLVKSTDDFGRNGARPSDQELLDALALRFIADGWSTKKMLRLLVTSPLFQEAGRAPRRLDAEAVHDAILAVSGRLDPKMYGESVQPHRQIPQSYRRLFQGPLDGNGRRAIYTKVTRMEGPRFLEIFDFSAPLQTRGARDVTNVPPQALAMLNDPFVVEQAGVWAERLKGSFEQKLTEMFETALAREPSEEEMKRWRELARELEGPRLWQDLAHAIFNLKEFLYVR